MEPEVLLVGLLIFLGILLVPMLGVGLWFMWIRLDHMLTHHVAGCPFCVRGMQHHCGHAVLPHRYPRSPDAIPFATPVETLPFATLVEEDDPNRSTEIHDEPPVHRPQGTTEFDIQNQ